MSLYIIVLMCALTHMGFGGSRVAVSLFAIELGAEQFAIGAIMALYALCPMLLAIYAGKLVDRLGPRLPMLGGAIGVASGLLLPYFFPSLATLYVTGFVLGASFQFFFIAIQGTTGAIGGPESRARNYALLSMGFSAAAFLGPITAGLAIDHLGHLPAYLVLASCTVVPILLLWFKPQILPKGAPPPADDKTKSALDLLRIPHLRATYIASGIISAGWDLYQFYFPIYGHAIGLSASAIGTTLGFFGIATFVIRVFLPRLTRRYTESQILTYAIFLAAFVFMFFPLFHNPYLLAVISFLLGLGLGCGQPVSMTLIYSLSPPGRASEGAGIRVMFNNVMHLVVPLAFGGLGSLFGFAPVFIANAGLLFAGGYYRYRNEESAAPR
jgi:MFS family permease